MVEREGRCWGRFWLSWLMVGHAVGAVILCTGLAIKLTTDGSTVSALIFAVLSLAMAAVFAVVLIMHRRIRRLSDQ